MVSKEKSNVILIFAPLCVIRFSSVVLSKIFLNSFFLNMICLYAPLFGGRGGEAFILFCVLFCFLSLTFLDLWFSIWHPLGEILTRYFFKCCFCSFLCSLPSSISPKHMLHIRKLPHSSQVFCSLWSCLLSLLSSFVVISSSSEVLSSVISSLQTSPSKAWFTYVTAFLFFFFFNV